MCLTGEENSLFEISLTTAVIGKSQMAVFIPEWILALFAAAQKMEKPTSPREGTVRSNDKEKSGENYHTISQESWRMF